MAPAFRQRGFEVYWTDLAALIGLGGIWLAYFIFNLKSRPLLPANDPRDTYSLLVAGHGLTTIMEHTVHHSPNGAGHEQSEVSVRLIVVSLAGLAVATFFVFVLVVGIFRYFYDTYNTEQATKLTQPVIPPEPRIEVAPYEQRTAVARQGRPRFDHLRLGG